MQTSIGPNRPLFHAQGFILSILIYNLTIFGNRARCEQGNARSWDRSTGTRTKADFTPVKTSDFYPTLSGIHMARNWWSQAAPFLDRHVAGHTTKANFKPSLLTFSLPLQPSPSLFLSLFSSSIVGSFKLHLQAHFRPIFKTDKPVGTVSPRTSHQHPRIQVRVNFFLMDSKGMGRFGVLSG